MNILYAYRYGIVGGVSTQLFLRKNALQALGYRCDLFFSQDNGLRAVLGESHGVYFGCDIRPTKLLKTGDYDHIVIIDTPELLAASDATGLRRRRSVWLDVHTTTATGLSYLADVDIQKLAGVMVPTHYSARLVQHRLPGIMPVVIPNIIDGSVFYPQVDYINACFIRSTSPRQYVWVGKLDSHKNWRLALVYAQLLQDFFGQIRFTFVGGYTAPASVGMAFFELAERLGVIQSIRWIDRIDNRALAALYRQCAQSGGAMLVTSRDESFGMAATEALLCGCPLITNDLPVFREVLPDSRMIRRLDIWQPAQVQQAAESLAHPPSAEDCDEMYKFLTTRFGPPAFLAALNSVLEV